MSDLRIALVAEGNTDAVVIQAALTAMLGARSFILTQLQPEETKPKMGTGWCGVRKWCQATSKRHTGSLDDDPTLDEYDLLILHLDVDVAGFKYADCGPEVASLAANAGWLPLPCTQPCPPPHCTAAQLEAVLKCWLGAVTPGTKTLLCMPAQASGTWLAAAVLPQNHQLRNGIECNVGVESGLAHLPKALRIRKTVREYRDKAPVVIAQWNSVKAQCSQAAVFEQSVLDRV